MKKIITILLVVMCSFAHINLQAQACNAPIINSFSPTTGFIGSTVTITGANFSAVTTNNQVFFGATQATVLTASFGVLTVTVPVGATTSPISVKNNCNLTAYSPISFNGIFCPTPLTSTTYQNTAFSLPGIVGAYNMLSQDIDGDGKPDIVSEGFGSNFTIARNTSTPGNMSFSGNFISSPGPRSVAVADFDGDGKRDLLSNGYVHRNQSTPGVISMSSGIFIGNSGYQCAAGDINGDGKIDAISGNGNNITICLNTSSGPGIISFAAPISTISSGGFATGLQMADIDGDGKTDILGTQGNNNRAFSLRNITAVGSSTPQFETVEFWSSNGSYPYRCQIADFDKDGKIDITTCNFSGAANTAVFRNTSVPGNISFANAFTMPAPNSNYRIAVGDVNGDGLPDIVTKSSGANIFSVYPNTSTGAGIISFGTRIDYTSSNRAEVSGIVIGDLDGDFVPDIATSGSSSNEIRVHRNTSSQVDNTPPTANCKNIIVALSPSGTVTVSAAMIDNGSGDACGIGSLLINNNASVTFTCANIGANTVTLKVTDRAGNTSTCTAIVNVAPAAIIVAGQTTVCQGQTVLLNANQGDSYQWQNNGVDISGATNQSYTATVTGNYTVTVTNAGGCSGTSAATAITVNNNPTVNTLPTGNISLCPSGNAIISASTSSIYQWKLNGNNIPGATQQTYAATGLGSYSVQVVDLFGCSATSSPVVVASLTDNVAPTAICKNANVIIDANGNGSISVSDINNGSFDNCSGVTVTIPSGEKTTFSCVDAGKAFTVNILVTDASGNTSTCAATVTVSDPNTVCNQPPTAICKPLTIFANDNCNANATAVEFDGGSTDTDAGDVLTFTVLPAGPYSVGITNVTLTVTDSKGAFSSCTTTVTVSDNKFPVLTVPTTITVNNDANLCGAVVTYSTPIGIDNCTVTTIQTTGLASGSIFPVGTTINTFKATDASGNETLSSFNVIVNDNQFPALVNVPANTTVTCDAVPNAAIVTATDNCNTSLPLFSESKVNGTCPNSYTLIRTWSTTDASGNNTKATQTIEVTDTQAPTLSLVPSNITVSCDAVPTPAIVTASDNCDNAPVVTYSQTSTQNADMNNAAHYNYQLTRTWIATDACGNSSSITQIIIVKDETSPIAICKPLTVTLSSLQNGIATISAASINNGSSDNCSPVTLSLSKSSFSCSNIGSNQVTLTVTDASGNKSTCNTIVTVVGEIPSCSVASIPTNNVFTGGVPTNLYLGYGPQSTKLQVSTPTSGAPYTYSWSGTGLSAYNTANPVFSATLPGNYVFTVQVINKYGCTTTCTISICVRDIRVPGTDGKKVYVCHIPPGNPSNAHTLSISVNAVPAHIGLHGGDKLGTCNMQACNATNDAFYVDTKENSLPLNSNLEVTVAPNPSTTYFEIAVKTKNTELLNIRVLDANGRLVETLTKVLPNAYITIGSKLPVGLFFAEIIQGKQRKVVKLVKSN